VYGNMRYTLDRGHPLQVPCGEKALNFTPKLFFCGVFRYTPAVEVVGIVISIAYFGNVHSKIEVTYNPV
jgi:hypothetical protein